MLKAGCATWTIHSGQSERSVHFKSPAECFLLDAFLTSIDLFSMIDEFNCNINIVKQYSPSLLYDFSWFFKMYVNINILFSMFSKRVNDFTRSESIELNTMWNWFYNDVIVRKLRKTSPVVPRISTDVTCGSLIYFIYLHTAVRMRFIFIQSLLIFRFCINIGCM